MMNSKQLFRGILVLTAIALYSFSIRNVVNVETHLPNAKNTINQKDYTFSWLKTDTSVALKDKGQVVWQFNFNKEHDKPYFFPLRAAKTSLELASYSPPDHPWHRGLWFSWKLINGVNYWEEDPVTRLSNGRTKINSVRPVLNKDFSASITLNLTYAPEGGKEVLNENRTILVSAPDAAGNYYIDWNLKFKAGGDTVELDRTPPGKFGGPFYGGYAGLSYRASLGITQTKYTDETGWEYSGDSVGHGQKAKWMDLSGVTDSSTRSIAGLTMFDLSTNVNSPTPWYIFNGKHFAFINASPLFDQKITILPNKQLNLSYRVLVHEGSLSKKLLEAENDKFTRRYSKK